MMTAALIMMDRRVIHPVSAGLPENWMVVEAVRLVNPLVKVLRSSSRGRTGSAGPDKVMRS